jgi:beta-galactosidase GanA
MASRSTLVPGLHALLHGGDYNPEQWQGYPQIVDS